MSEQNFIDKLAQPEFPEIENLLERLFQTKEIAGSHDDFLELEDFIVELARRRFNEGQAAAYAESISFCQKRLRLIEKLRANPKVKIYETFADDQIKQMQDTFEGMRSMFARTIQR